MKILYVAKHHQRSSNDDEGSVSYALQALGHEVIEMQEQHGARDINKHRADFVLFHHWRECTVASRLPKVFWCFDLIDYPDPSIEVRCKTRVRWAEQARDASIIGFHTDGDWVARDTTGKLHWLMQGADERIVGRGDPKRVTSKFDILFTGMSRGGGRLRESFVEEMHHRWSSKFTQIPAGSYRETLASVLANTKIAVAPDSPCTPRYWSNRVYTTLGFGGFLLHPYCDGLLHHYTANELAMYGDREHLHSIIDYFLAMTAEQRTEISERGMQRTMKDHLYRHRVAELIEKVKGVL